MCFRSVRMLPIFSFSSLWFLFLACSPFLHMVFVVVLVLKSICMFVLFVFGWVVVVGVCRSEKLRLFAFSE